MAITAEDGVHLLDDLPRDLLSLLLGRLGMRRMLLAAAVSRSWRDAATAKLAEWAALTPICTVGSAWRDAIRPSQSSSWYTRPLGDAPGELRWPCFLTTVPAGVGGTHAGDVIVSEHGNGRISVFEPDSLRHRCCLGSEGGPLGGRFCRPTGVAVSPEDGALLVADCGSGRIVRLGLDASAPAIRPGASRLEQPCGDVRNVKQPYGLAIAPNGRTLFFADSRMHRIVEVDGYTGGALVGSWGRHGVAPGELDHPRGLTIHGSELIVADRGNHRLQVFDVSHAVHFSASRSRAARAPTTEGGMLLHPVDTLLPEVVLAPLRVIGGEGRGPGRFCGPYDTAVARSRLVVSEFEGRRVQVLTLMGAPLQILSLPGNGAPTGIAASADGFSVFIAQFDLHRLHRLSMRTGPPPGDIDVGLAAATDNFEACGERRIAAGILSA